MQAKDIKRLLIKQLKTDFPNRQRLAVLGAFPAIS